MSTDLPGPRNGGKRRSPSAPLPPDASVPEDGSSFPTPLQNPQPSSLGDSSATQEEVSPAAGTLSSKDEQSTFVPQTARKGPRRASVRKPTGPMSTAQAEGLGPIVAHFLAEWKQGREPRIDDFLARAGAHRAALLIELVHADMESRLETGRANSVEDYLEQYPELEDEEAVKLIVRDYELRRRRGMSATIADYLTRFPRLQHTLIHRFPSTVPSFRDPEPEPDTYYASGAPARPRVRLPGKFKPLDKLGEGGMGEVWRVRRTDLGKERAVKLLLSGAACSHTTIVRMQREAWAMAQLEHRHAVTVHDVCLGDVPYIEMEYVRGQTLDKVLQPDVPMTPEWTAKLLEQLCDVLEAAHKIPIVHRDLKPSNLMLVDGDSSDEINLKVLDFGISKFLDAAPDELLTIDGQTLGTLLYMSPEQLDSSKDVDARSDLYSVGVILYECLTGCRPFTSRYQLICRNVNNIPAPRFKERNPKAKVPPAVEKLVLRCLENNPDRRPASAKALADEFRRLVTPQEREQESDGKTSPKSRRAFIAAVLITVAVLGSLGLYRLLHPASFSVLAVPTALDLQAGKSESISLVVAPELLASKLKVEVVEDLPKGMRIQEEPAGGGQRQYRVVTDPNLIDQSERKRHSLRFIASDGRTERTTSVEVVIHPPNVAPLPDRWVRRQGAALVAINGKYYPREMERAGPDESCPAVALLIEKHDRGQPDPFYMLRDKVWEGLFDEFATANPKIVPDSRWRGEGGDPLLPVRNVTGLQAQAFAEWLGGRGQGFLPTCEQWDQAAGRNLKDSRPGPFREPWDPKDTSQIAVDLRAPRPIGQSSHDISPSGCRDMSGNGYEWTRLPPNKSLDETVELRGQSYKATRPLLFEKFKKGEEERFPFNDADSDIGFRVVIEIP